MLGMRYAMRQAHQSVRVSTMLTGEYVIDAAFNAGFIAGLKTDIPYTDREWDGKYWHVKGHKEKLEELISLFYGQTINIK